MIPIITASIYALFSAVIILIMRVETNRRLISIQPDENDNLAMPRLYDIKGITVTAGICLVMISAVCGYVVSQNAVSLLASIELGLCYMAVLAAAIVDFKTRTIPNFIPALLVLARLLIFIHEIIFVDAALNYLISSLLGCFICAFLLGIANAMSKGSIGGGDIKLLSCIGLMCGTYVVFSTLLLSLIMCILVSGILFLLKRKMRTDSIPFGPFIYFGLTIMCLFTLY